MAKKSVKSAQKKAPSSKSAVPQPVSLEEIVRQTANWREAHRRTAYRPVVKKGDGAVTDSKFSGAPWLAKDEAWPMCKSCRRPLQLFLQLNLGKLPRELGKKFGSGLLQLFYCRHSWRGGCQDDGGFEYFSDQVSLCRVVQPKGSGRKSDEPRAEGYFPAKTITGWKAIDDVPSPQDHEDLGITYEYDWSGNRVTVRSKDPPLKLVGNLDDEVAEAIGRSAEDDKLAGWPLWVQDADYCRCPQCNTRMEVVFQLTSNDQLPFMFGDMGAGHVQQCPKHPHVVAFGWACS